MHLEISDILLGGCSIVVRGHGDGSVVVMKKDWDGYAAVSVQMLISSVLDGGFGVWCCSLQLVLEWCRWSRGRGGVGG